MIWLQPLYIGVFDFAYITFIRTGTGSKGLSGSEFSGTYFLLKLRLLSSNSPTKKDPLVSDVGISHTQVYIANSE